MITLWINLVKRKFQSKIYSSNDLGIGEVPGHFVTNISRNLFFGVPLSITLHGPHFSGAVNNDTIVRKFIESIFLSRVQQNHKLHFSLWRARLPNSGCWISLVNQYNMPKRDVIHFRWTINVHFNRWDILNLEWYYYHFMIHTICIFCMPLNEVLMK